MEDFQSFFFFLEKTFIIFSRSCWMKELTKAFIFFPKWSNFVLWFFSLCCLISCSFFSSFGGVPEKITRVEVVAPAKSATVFATDFSTTRTWPSLIERVVRDKCVRSNCISQESLCFWEIAQNRSSLRHFQICSEMRCPSSLLSATLWKPEVCTESFQPQ